MVYCFASKAGNVGWLTRLFLFEVTQEYAGDGVVTCPYFAEGHLTCHFLFPMGQNHAFRLVYLLLSKVEHMDMKAFLWKNTSRSSCNWGRQFSVQLLVYFTPRYTCFFADSQDQYCLQFQGCPMSCHSNGQRDHVGRQKLFDNVFVLPLHGINHFTCSLQHFSCRKFQYVQSTQVQYAALMGWCIKCTAPRTNLSTDCPLQASEWEPIKPVKSCRASSHIRGPCNSFLDLHWEQTSVAVFKLSSW